MSVWIIVFWLAIIIINVFGTLGFAEEEFWSSCLKLTAIGSLTCKSAAPGALESCQS